MSLLVVDNLTVGYAEDDAPAVRGLSFEMQKGESLGIVGESGAGKSQTALSVMGLLPRNAQVGGSVQIAGTEMIGASDAALRQSRARTVSMVFQDPATALNPYRKIGHQMIRVMLEHGLGNKRQAKKKCIELLERVGLPDPHKQYRSYPHQLSGGMRQRAHIASALIGDPELIVADEPTTALDVTIQAQILELLGELQRESSTALLLITHDLGVISRCCDNVLVMDEGVAVERGLRSEVFANPQTEHTQKLIAAAPHLDEPPPPPKEVGEPIVEVSDLSIRYRDRRRRGRGDVVAVESLSLSVGQGETVAIVGESGSGKTSLARCMAGLLPGRTGSVSFAGKVQPWRVERRNRWVRRNLQMVFQDPVSSLNPMMRVGQIVAEPLVVHENIHGKDIAAEVSATLERVGLGDEFTERYAHELSGGQAQRVAIARSLAPNPSVLICDEAMAALDGTVRREILALLKKVQEESNITLLIITHDLGVVREIADRVVVMHEGGIVEEASNLELFSAPREEYTKALLAAVPRLS